MIKVSDVVKEIISNSGPEFTAMSRGVLNLSAYAKAIHKEVERRARKPVKLGSIIVALSRLSKEISDRPLVPDSIPESMAVRSRLAELCFAKTPRNKAKAQKLFARKEFAQADYFSIVYGIAEISIFIPVDLVPSTLETFAPVKPKFKDEDLAGLTLQYKPEVIDTPNLYYSLFSALAARQINVIEVSSTFTESTFLVRQRDLSDLFNLINSLMQSPPTSE